MSRSPESLYAAFDTYPAPKGAAVHIREFARALFSFSGNGLLLTLGAPELPSWQIETNCEIRRLNSSEPNYLKRATEFSDFVHFHSGLLKNSLKIAHFRDPWSGLPILNAINQDCKTVYEVNALPSIELPTRYSRLASTTLDKIRAFEKQCLERVDSIVCPSEVIKKCLIELGTSPRKITVIPNGAEIVDLATLEKPVEAPETYLIYVGAVQPWQGLEILFKAMTFLSDLPELKLALCVSGNKSRIKYLYKLSERLQISDRLIWHHKLTQNQIYPWLAHAAISLAPLTECARNLFQGCSPIKIIESMAMGTPVIASDLPVTRELLEHNHTGWLVRPDRPSELARAIRILAFHREERQKLGINARNKAIKDFDWQHSANKLQNLYQKLLKTSLV